MKKRLIILLSTLLLLTPSFGKDGLSFQLSEQQLEEKITPYFPFRRSALMGQIKFELSQPDLILKAGSQRAELQLKSKITSGGSQFPGNLKLSFGVDYTPKTGTFYLIEPRVENFQVSGVSTAVTSTVTSYLMPILQKQLMRVPVYTLKAPQSNGQNIARHTLKKISIADKSLNVSLGWVDSKTNK